METDKKTLITFLLLIYELKITDSLETIKYLRSIGFHLKEAIYMKDKLLEFTEMLKKQITQ